MSEDFPAGVTAQDIDDLCPPCEEQAFYVTVEVLVAKAQGHSDAEDQVRNLFKPLKSMEVNEFISAISEAEA